MDDDDQTGLAYQFRVQLAHRNLRRLHALIQAGARDALSYFSEQELADMESVEREGD